MGTIKNFEELAIWKLSREMANLVYKDFKNCRDFSFKDQILRAGISVMNNISEGFARNSDAEFRHFLNIAKGSSAEIKSMYYLAEDQKFIDNNLANERRIKIQCLSNGIGSLMKYLKPVKKDVS